MSVLFSASRVTGEDKPFVTGAREIPARATLQGASERQNSPFLPPFAWHLFVELSRVVFVVNVISPPYFLSGCLRTRYKGDNLKDKLSSTVESNG